MVVVSDDEEEMDGCFQESLLFFVHLIIEKEVITQALICGILRQKQMMKPNAKIWPLPKIFSYNYNAKLILY